MGNLFSRPAEGPAEFTSEWIENLYAARAAMNTATTVSCDEEDDKATPSLDQDDTADNVTIGIGQKDTTATVEAEYESKPKDNQNQPIVSANWSNAIKNLDNVNVPGDALDAATIQLTIAIRSGTINAHEALQVAIDKLKKMDLIVVARAVSQWIRNHPWETAAIVIPLVLLACTPAFLGLAGFTAGGIAAGSMAAGIQAGIGSVAAGSVFATLTSAAMAGYGLPIVLGTVWGASSAVMWGIAAWKEGCKGDANDDEDDGELDNSAAMVLRT